MVNELIVLAIPAFIMLVCGVLALLDFLDARRERKQRERRYAAEARRDRWDETRRNIIRLERELGLRE